MTDADFLRAVLLDPADDAPRLVYADWLEERGDADAVARAQLIRAQCEFAEMSRNKVGRRGSAFYRRRKALEAVADALLVNHGGRFAAPVAAAFGSTQPGADYGYEGLSWVRWSWRRGFVAAVHLPAAKLVEHGRALFAAAPIEQVELRHVRPRNSGGRYWGFTSRPDDFPATPWFVPPAIFAELWPSDQGSPQSTARRWYRFAFRANQSLEAAATAWGRKAAGLPPLPSRREPALQ